MIKKIKNLNRIYECETCKNSGHWQGQKLTLQIDHIDGDRLNNSENNLRYLCPNCHSQTSTFCGRNIKSKYAKFEDFSIAQIIEAANGEINISSVMRKLNLNTNNNVIRKKIEKAIISSKINLEYVPSIEQYEKIALLKSSSIDFTKQGWVKMAADILGTTPQNVNRWLRKNFPSFLENCYARKINKRKFVLPPSCEHPVLKR